MVVTLRYFTEFGKPVLQKTMCCGIYATIYCILVRVQCRRKQSSRSLSHLLMSFLLVVALKTYAKTHKTTTTLQISPAQQKCPYKI